MATKAQYAAARKANAAYKAAKTSWAKAKVFSSAAKSLWVSGSKANKIYNRPKTSTASTYSKPKATKPAAYNTPTTSPASTYKPVASSYGDVRVWVGGRDTYSWIGTWLSWGKSMTDLSKFWGLQGAQEFDKFGSQAEEAERLNPWFLSKRNDVYGMDILKQTQDYQKMTDQDKDNVVRDYLKSRDTDSTLFSWERGEEDVRNTVWAIRARLGEMEQWPSQEKDALTAAWDREILDLEDRYDQDRKQMLRAWAIEDRYTNFNEINDNIQGTMEVAWQHRADNMYTGMPTDEQIDEIAQQSGNDFATTKQILEGRGYEALEMQWEFKEKAERWYTRWADDLEQNRQRAITDADTSHMRTQTALNEQIDDVQRTMERKVAVWEKSWALSWANRSSWYMQGLDNIRTDALRNMDRLKTRKDWDTEDTAQMKTIITDDFERDITRNWEDLTTAMNSLKMEQWLSLSSYLHEVSPSSTEMSRRLRELEDDFDNKSLDVIAKYHDTSKKAVDDMYYKTEKLLELEQTQQNLQQTNVTNLLQNNWAALAGLSYNNLSEMLQQGTISPTDYSTMTWYMNTLWVSALQSMWVPTQQDLQMYNSFLDQNMTPSQAINAVAQASWGRLSMAATAEQNDWKLNTSTNEYYRTWADGNLEFSDTLTAEQTAQSTYTAPQYDAADQSDMQNWEVFLYNSKLGSDWGQCGSYVNDYLQSMWIDRLFVDPISAKMAVKNSDIPAIGSVAIIDRQNNPNATDAQKKYWHVWIVTAVNADGTVTLKQSNNKWDETVFKSNYPASTISGYFDPTKGAETVMTPAPEEETAPEYNMTDISTYNNSTFKPQTSLKTAEDKAQYEQFLNDRDAIMSDPDANLDDILDYSAWGKDLTDGAITRIDKYSGTLKWVWDLQEMIADAKVSWPVMWYLASINPYNTDAQAIKSKLTSLIPWLARWVYWEVWVLTDRDVALYSQTIPNLTQTEDVQKAVLWMTLRTISNWYKDILQSQAAAGRDVSWYAGMLERINRMAYEIEESLWMNKEAPVEIWGWVWWSISDIRD